MNKIITIVFAVLVLAGCKREDFCSTQQPTSAAFRMQEVPFASDASNWTFTDTDTSVNTDMLFTALDSTADAYEWRIGAGVYTTRSKSLRFPGSFVSFPNALPVEVPITLILRRKPNTACFPKDDGVDTVTRTLRFLNECRSLVQGDFLGHDEGSPRDTFTVSVRLCQTLPPGQLGSGVFISGLLRGCGRIYRDSRIAYDALGFGDGTSGCQGVSGVARIGDDRNKITIDYTIFDANFQNISRRRFTGTRKRL